MIMSFVAGLVVVESGLAHVNVRPGLVESGQPATLRIELPELRPGLTPSALDVSGPGLRMLASSSTGRIGEESRWRVRVDVQTEPGPLNLVLSARYPDGRSVVLRQTVTVLPDDSAASSSWPVLPAVVGVLAVLGAVAGFAFVRRARGPTQPDRGG